MSYDDKTKNLEFSGQSCPTVPYIFKFKKNAKKNTLLIANVYRQQPITKDLFKPAMVAPLKT